MTRADLDAQRVSDIASFAFTEKGFRTLLSGDAVLVDINTLVSIVNAALASQAPAVQQEPVGWITYQTKDGKQKLEVGSVAANPEYCKVHHNWVWLPLYLATPSPQGDAELIKHLENHIKELKAENAGLSTLFDVAVHERNNAIDASSLLQGYAEDAARYRWLANRVLACDFGDNKTKNNQIGWLIVNDLCTGHPSFIFGSSIDTAIDAARKVKP